MKYLEYACEHEALMNDVRELAVPHVARALVDEEPTNVLAKYIINLVNQQEDLRTHAKCYAVSDLNLRNFAGQIRMMINLINVDGEDVAFANAAIVLIDRAIA